MKQRKRQVVTFTGAALLVFAALVHADQPPAAGGNSGRGMTSGMMGGHGSEMMGRGRMGRRGPETMGWGMMGGHGSAASSARGMGLGTMLEGVELTEEQRAQLQPLDDELFRKQWEITGKTIEAQRKLRRQSSMAQRDDKAIAEAHKMVRELREQRLLAESQTREKLEGILTEAQRERLRLRQHECMEGQA